jgi:hypothetical protein
MTASRTVLDPAVDERRRSIKPALGMLAALVLVAVAVVVVVVAAEAAVARGRRGRSPPRSTTS